VATGRSRGTKGSWNATLTIVATGSASEDGRPIPVLQTTPLRAPSGNGHEADHRRRISFQEWVEECDRLAAWVPRIDPGTGDNPGVRRVGRASLQQNRFRLRANWTSEKSSAVLCTRNSSLGK